MSEKPKHPSLEDIKANLLEARDNVHFNIGSPAAIDHLLVSIVCVIDALLYSKAPFPTTQKEDK